MTDRGTQNGSRRRHCMVVHAYYPLREPRVERQAQALCRHGFEVDVICLKQPEASRTEVVDGVNVYRLPVQRHRGSGAGIQALEYLAFFFLVLFKLVALHARRKYHVVQVHNLPDFLIFAAIGPKLAGARLILDLHDLMPDFYASRFNRSLESWPVRLLIWQEQASCWFADRVITVTDLWRESLIQRGTPPDKVFVVMNVADTQVFRRLPAGDRPRRQAGRFNLIYHGTLTYRYGVDLILEALQLLRPSMPGVFLTIHGQGEYLETLIELTKRMDLEDQVRFSTRMIPMAQLPALIGQADVGIVPNRSNLFTDAILPTKLMEYVALGIPAIAARTPAIATYFDDTMVEFFNPGDAAELAACILRLSGDPERLIRLVNDSDRFNQTYDWNRKAADYVALVEQTGRRT